MGSRLLLQQYTILLIFIYSFESIQVSIIVSPPRKKEITSYKIKRESIINKLANEFDKHLKISSLLN